MSIVRWNPFRELNALHEDVDRLFSRMGFPAGSPRMGFGDPARLGNSEFGQQSWMLPMDVMETDEAIKLKVALPGLDPKDINVHVEDNVLTVSGERRFEDKVEEGNYHWIEQQYGTFSRSVTLPQSADLERIEAQYNNGVLQLTVPKRQETRRRKIELTGAETAPRMIEAGEDTKVTDQAEQKA
jgi:HSP20 family protein